MALGVVDEDGMLVFHFDEALAVTAAEDFVGEVLAKQIGAAGVVTGDDFTFGRGRKGDVEALRTLGEKSGIVAEAVAPVALGELRISSGRIREALEAGDTAVATKLMGPGYARRRQGTDDARDPVGAGCGHRDRHGPDRAVSERSIRN